MKLSEYLDDAFEPDAFIKIDEAVTILGKEYLIIGITVYKEEQSLWYMTTIKKVEGVVQRDRSKSFKERYIANIELKKGMDVLKLSDMKIGGQEHVLLGGLGQTLVNLPSNKIKYIEFFSRQGLLKDWMGRDIESIHISERGVKCDLNDCKTISMTFEADGNEYVVDQEFAMDFSDDSLKTLTFTDPVEGLERSFEYKPSLFDFNEFYNKYRRENPCIHDLPDDKIVASIYVEKSEYFYHFYTSEFLNKRSTNRNASVIGMIGEEDGFMPYCIGYVPKDFKGQLNVSLFSISQKGKSETIVLEISSDI